MLRVLVHESYKVKRKDDMKGYVNNFKKYKNLLWELVKKGIKLKYRRSYLGIIWTLLEPVLTTVVLTTVFTYLMPKDSDAFKVAFPVYILTGRLLYTFFSGATKTALSSIRKNSGMIKKVYVPKYLYPLSGVLYNFVIFLISLVVLLGAGIVFKVKPSFYIIEGIIPLFLLLLLSFGVGMILSPVAVFFRDVEYLWGVLLMLIMYASAIMYSANDIIKKALEKGNMLVPWLFKCNPLYGIITMFRDCVLFGKGIDFTSPYFIMSASVSVLSVIVGLFVFYKKQDDFILHI